MHHDPKSTQVVDFPHIDGEKNEPPRHKDTKERLKLMMPGENGKRVASGAPREGAFDETPALPIIGLARGGLVVNLGEPCFGQVHRSRWPFCFGSSNDDIRT
jgi:hypothetical protein